MTSSSATTSDPLTPWWRIPRTERGIAATGLLIALFLAAAPANTSAWHNLDPSWQTGINAARLYGLQFGSDLVFTYGPWGFLDHPYTLDRLQFIAGVLVATAVVAVLWVATYAGLRRLVSERAATITATLATTLSAAVAEISTLAVTAAAMVVILDLLTPRDEPRSRWSIGYLAPSVAACSGLFLQVKLSTGLAMLVVALLAACAQRPVRRALLTLAASVGCVIASFLACWLVIGQDLGDIPAWLRGSREAISGYSEAMATERLDYLVGYVVAIGLGGFILVASVRGALSLGRARGVVLVVLCLALLDIMLKAAFTRHDQHELAFFVMTTGLLVVLGPLMQHRTAALVAVGISLAMIVPGLQPFDVGQVRDRWRVALQVVLVPGAEDGYNTISREQGQATYLLPQTFVDLIGHHPVAVDPFEAALPIDYGMQWRPMPVFQTYAAYTAYLDDLNAKAARNAPDDQLVLRSDAPTIDGRNPHWETPAYLLALACDYEVVHREGTWTLLQHAEPRCGTAEQVKSQRVSAGQKVAVPDAGPDEIVVASFEPDPPGLLTRAFTAAFKGVQPFEVTVDGHDFRMPQGLAGQPAIMTYPDEADHGLFAPFDYGTVAYSRPGTVTFDTISTSG